MPLPLPHHLFAFLLLLLSPLRSAAQQASPKIRTSNNDLLFSLPANATLRVEQANAVSGLTQSDTLATRGDVAAAQLQTQSSMAALQIQSSTQQVSISALQAQNQALQTQLSSMSALLLPLITQSSQLQGQLIAVNASMQSAVVAEAARAGGVEGSLARALTQTSSQALATTASLASSDLALSLSLAALNATAASVAASVPPQVAAEASRAGGVEGSLSLSISSAQSQTLALSSGLALSLNASVSSLVVSQQSVRAFASAAVIQETSRAIAVETQLSAAAAAQLACSSNGLFLSAGSSGGGGGGGGGANTCFLPTVFCPCPALGNGQASCVGPVALQQSISLTCNAGYALTPAIAVITCVANQTYNIPVPSCVAPLCPGNTTGPNVAQGCACNLPGFTGNTFPISTPPFYSGGCTAVPCPANSVGTAPTCTCASGFAGSVVPVANGYTSSCTLPVCSVSGGGFPYSGTFCSCAATWPPGSAVGAPGYSYAASSTISGAEPLSGAFDNNPSVFWTCLSNYYTACTAQSCNYNGPNSMVIAGTTYRGEWLQLGVPSLIVIKAYQIVPRPGFTGRGPYTHVIAASNDTTTWTLLDTRTVITGWTNNGFVFCVSSNNIAALFFRLSVQSVQTTDSWISVGEMKYFT